MMKLMLFWQRNILVICNLLFVILLLPTPILAATLSLSPATGSFGRNCNFSVNVVLDTQAAQTEGTDAILLYDPTQFSAQNIVTGKIYADFPGNTIDNSAGKVSIFALAPTDQPFAGSGTVATVNFTTTASASASPATISLDFDASDPTKSTDSNVIDKTSLKDILSGVTNGSYTINAGSTGCKTVSQTPQKGGVTTLPDSGIPEMTWAFSGLGIISTAFGLWGIKKFNHVTF